MRLQRYFRVHGLVYDMLFIHDGAGFVKIFLKSPLLTNILWMV